MDRPETSRSLSRRQFTALTAAAAGAVLAPGAAGRTAASETQTSDIYDFLLETVSAEYDIPTLVTFRDSSGYEVLAELSVEYREYTGGDALAYAQLTPEDATELSEHEKTAQLEYAPGSNPFWKVDGYEDGIFLPPEESVDFIGYDEAVAGLEQLEATHEDRFNFRTIGTGSTYPNQYDESAAPPSLWALELTANIDDETAFENKEKLVFSLSIHGDERAGIESGLRFIEDILDGERPDIASLLSEFVLVFVNPNPAGWVAREPLYDQFVEPSDFRRANGTENDLNRQFPNSGWINPQFHPADPDGRNLVDDDPDAIDDDVPVTVQTEVPEALAVVDYLRSYENVEYFVDLHGMYGHTNAILSITPGGGSPRERANRELLNRRIETQIEESLGTVEDWTETFQTAIEDFETQQGCSSQWFCQKPQALFGYGTATDTIGYSGTGFFESWVNSSEDNGGLGATPVTMEIVFSNSPGDGVANTFLPEVTAFHVAAYQAVCVGTITHAASEFDVTVKTNDRSTAYVTTDTLTRSATALPHFEASQSSLQDGTVDGVGGSAPGGSDGTLAGPGDGVDLTGEATDGASETPTTTLETTVQSHTVASQFEQPIEVAASTHTVDIAIESADGTPLAVTLRDDEGAVVRQESIQFDPAQLERGGNKLVLTDPDPGEWTLDVRAPAPTDVDVETTRLETTQAVPDPIEALGYQQRDYEITPFTAFTQLAAATETPVDSITVEEIRDGGLFEDGRPAYDNLVVIHEDISETAIPEIEAFVASGGNLVLTDAGVTVAEQLDGGGLDAIGSGAVSRQTNQYASYEMRTPDEHPLLLGRREYADDSWISQAEPWQYRPLGYAREEAPIYEIDDSALSAADARVPSSRIRSLATVPTTNDRVGVHLIGSLLPPGSQTNLHPFGLEDHSLTQFGYQLLCNALGYELAFSRDGETVATFGSTVEPTLRAREESTAETPDGTETPTDDDTPTDSDKSQTQTETGSDDTPTDTGGGDTPGDDTPSTQTATGATETAADGGGAGFGITTGLASLGGAGYLLRQRLGDDETGT